MALIQFLIFSFSLFIASELQLELPEGINLLNCQCNVFVPSIAFMLAGFL